MVIDKAIPAIVLCHACLAPGKTGEREDENNKVLEITMSGGGMHGSAPVIASVGKSIAPGLFMRCNILLLHVFLLFVRTMCWTFGTESFLVGAWKLLRSVVWFALTTFPMVGGFQPVLIPPKLFEVLRDRHE
jgi:hypothetical protein